MGGAERQISYLAPALNRRGLRGAIINVSPTAGTAWMDAGVKLVTTRSSRPISRLLEISQLLRQWQPRIVHGWHYQCNIYAGISGRLAGVKLRLGSLRNDLLFELAVCKRAWRPLVFRSVQGLIANTKRALANRRLVNYPLPPMLTIWNGIDSAEWQGNRGPGGSFFPNNAFVLGIIARIAWEKAPLFFIEAFDRFRCEVAEARALWIGDGPLRGELEQEISRRRLGDHVKLLGRQPNVGELLPAISAMTLTSLHEGMPNALMEGAASGRPAVATDVGGNAEVIEDGVTGIIVPPGNEPELIAAWKKLAMNRELREKMGQAARKRMAERFASERMVENFAALYQRLMAGEPFAGIAAAWEP